MRAYASRVRTTCASSPHATTDARWTNSCGAVPTLGRKRRSAAISSGSPATKPLRNPVIEERFDSVLNATTFVQSSSCSTEGGGSSNQSSLYASSDASTKPCARAQSREPLEERQRGNGPGGVVRRVQPDERRASPEVVGHVVERREEAVLLEERKLDDTCAGERGTATGDGVAGLGDDDRVASAGGVDHDLREREDRLLRAEGRDHVAVGVDLHSETALDPGRDRLTKLRQAGRRRVAHPLPDTVAQRLQDRRVRRLPRIAHPEVDHLEALGAPRRRSLVQPDERVRLLRPEGGREGHASDARRSARRRAGGAPRRRARATRARRARRGGARSAWRRARS